MTDLRDPTLPAEAVRAALGLSPHPEGGWFRELHREFDREGATGGRGAVTSILFLLAAGERSHWHRVDATEIWYWHAGAPLLLGIAGVGTVRLGPDLAADAVQATVPPGAWQEAVPTGAWTLVSCAVAPAFEFAGFELAPPGWSPPGWTAFGPSGADRG